MSDVSGQVVDHIGVQVRVEGEVWVQVGIHIGIQMLPAMLLQCLQIDRRTVPRHHQRLERVVRQSVVIFGGLVKHAVLS